MSVLRITTVIRVCSVLTLVPSLIAPLEGYPIIQKLGTVSELSLRKMAIKTVMPRYPGAAKAQRAVGIAVARVLIDENGTVSDVKVLEAPHSSIGAEMVSAIKLWKFVPVTSSSKEPLRVMSKLTFYFSFRKGKAYVHNPMTVSTPRDG